MQTPYRIDGGFRAWEANGLRIKQVGSETALSIIKEVCESKAGLLALLTQFEIRDLMLS